MSKRTRQKEEETSPSLVQSKYFTIDSYFRSAANDTKRVKKTTQFDKEVEQAIALSLQQHEQVITEQCPLCNTLISTESSALQVHVNTCLDSLQEEQQKENTSPPSTSSLDSNIDNSLPSSSLGSLADKFSFDVSTESSTPNTSLESNNDDLENDDCNDTSLSSEIDSSSAPKPANILPPTAWKDRFSAMNSNTSTDDRVSLAFANKDINGLQSKTLSVKKKKICPFYKRVRDTRFVVDAFSYGSISDCDGYFLTHYHSDHFGGLRSGWSHGPIYCSKITANLVKQELNVNSRYIHALPMNELYPIPNSNVTVALIDANHCPGSVLFLFIVERLNGIKVRHLHTGDFRAAPRMCLHPLIKQPENPPINCLYLDTTYLSPQYAFPAQEECIQAVCELVSAELSATTSKRQPSLLEKWIRPISTSSSSTLTGSANDRTTTNNVFQQMMNRGKQALCSSKPKMLILVGTYTIGKERVFINIARMLKCKVYAPSKKKRILLCQEDKELQSMLTNDPLEAQVHVVPLRDIRADIMTKYLNEHKSHFDSLIAFKPTGWTYKSTSTQTSDMRLAPLYHIIAPPEDRSLNLKPYYQNDKIKLFGVPYSEHSSFRELASFIASLDIKQIIPTVNITQVQAMSVYFKKWEEEKMAKRIEVVSYPNESHW